MKTKRLYIVDGCRTPFAKMGSSLASIPADDLGRIAVTSLLTKLDLDPAVIDEVIFGCVAQPAEAPNLARVVALRSGIPHHVPAVTVQRNCASGLESIAQAFEKMSAGRGEVFLVGGAENMSQIPLFYKQKTANKFAALQRSKTLGQKIESILSFRPKDFAPKVGLMLGLSDPTCGMNMGQTAELIGRELLVSREDQDKFSLRSHQLAVAAREKLAEEICPVYLEKLSSAVEEDNGPREEQSMSALQKLRPVFDRHNGTVTAGNASQITDGAVALILATEEACQKHGMTPLGYIEDYQFAGCDPQRMGLGPVYAMSRLEERSGLTLDQADLIEINEAFAAQVLAVVHAARSTEFCQKYLSRSSILGEIPLEKLNVNGGAIALGHPVGATGSRLVLTSMKELHRRNQDRALVSLCIGGGQGGALWLHRA